MGPRHAPFARALPSLYGRRANRAGPRGPKPEGKDATDRVADDVRELDAQGVEDGALQIDDRLPESAPPDPATTRSSARDGRTLLPTGRPPETLRVTDPGR